MELKSVNNCISSELTASNVSPILAPNEVKAVVTEIRQIMRRKISLLTVKNY